MPSHLRSFVALLTLLLLLLTGCSRQNRIDRALKSADKYFAAEQYDKAEIEYLNVLKLESTNHLAIRNLAAIYFADERIFHAVAFLNTARRLDPNDIDTRARAARIFFTAGALKEARQEADFVLQRSPTNEIALFVLMDLAVKPEDLRGARQQIAQLRQRAGEQPVFQVAEGSLFLRETNFAAAEASFKAAAAADPNSALAHWALGTLYLGQTNLALAEPAFQTAAQYSPIRSPRRLKPIALKFQAGDVESAKKMIDEIAAKAPDFLPIWIYSARQALKEKNFQKCEADLARVLSRNPDHYDALGLHAEMLIIQGNIDKGILDLERLTGKYTKSAQARYQLAVALLLKKDTSRAIANLNQAVALDHNLNSATLLLADLNTRKGDTSAAIASVNDLLKRDPNSERAYVILANAYHASGKLNEAVAVYERLLKISPKNLDGRIRLGVTLRQLGKNAEARKSFEAILVDQPFEPMAMTQLAEMDVLAKDFPAAIQRVQLWLEHSPNEVEPAYQMARIRYAQGDVNATRAMLEKVIQMDSQAVSAYLMLARLYFASHQLDSALAQTEQALAKNPKDPAALLLSAVLQSEKGDYAKARDAYEILLSIQPQNVIALNNLAALYSDRFGQIEKAFPLARKAESIRPQDPTVADTFGWILTQRGEYSLALDILKDVVQKRPTDAEMIYHLGFTHYMISDEEAARSLLDRSLSLSTNFIGRAEVQQALAILKIPLNSTNAGARPLLEKRLTEKPADPVALDRFAAMLEKSGQTAPLAAAYEKALAANPKMARAQIGLAGLESTRPNNLPKAIDMARQANRLAPDDPKVSRLASAIAARSTDTKDQQWALSLLQDVSQKHGGDPDLSYDLAWAYYSQGRLDDAQAAMRSALASPRAPAAKRFLDFFEPNLSQAKIDEVLKADPNYIPALLARAEAARQKGDQAAAFKIYEQTLARYPDFGPVIRQAALISADPAKTYALATRARELYPDDPEISKTLGIAFYDRNDPTRALRFLAESEQKLTDDPSLQFYLGMSHYKLKQKPQAKSALNKALTLHLSDPFAAEAKRVLTELK